MPGNRDAESLVLHALESTARPGDVLIQGVRFTDPKNGDVEADFLLLVPGSGVAVLEVKGGLVSYTNGEWLLTGISDASYRRRIHPVDQARRAKHALRRYLDRQPDWNLGLVRATWFVVMPETRVDRDFGPEGLQDQLLGEEQLSALRTDIQSVLDSTFLPEPRPSDEEIEDIVSLLLRSDSIAIQRMSRPTAASRRSKRWVLWGTVGVVALLGAVTLGVNQYSGVFLAEQCSEHYEPCLPVADDLDCSDLETQVLVIGNDVYGLDRDGNGLGCESLPAFPD